MISKCFYDPGKNYEFKIKIFQQGSLISKLQSKEFFVRFYAIVNYIIGRYPSFFHPYVKKRKILKSSSRLKGKKHPRQCMDIFTSALQFVKRKQIEVINHNRIFSLHKD